MPHHCLGHCEVLDHTSCRCHLRYTRTTMLCNGSRPWGRAPRCSTSGQPLWRSTIFRLSIGQGNRRFMSMALVGYLSTLLLQKMPSSKSASCKTRKRTEDLLESSTPPPTSVGKRCGSSSATGTTTKPAAASASKPLRVVPNVNWAATMDIARRRLVLSCPKVPGIRCPLTLWDLCHRITARNSSSCSWIATPNTLSSFHPAIIPWTRWAKPSCATRSHTLELLVGSSLTAAENLSARSGRSCCAP